MRRLGRGFGLGLVRFLLLCLRRSLIRFGISRIWLDMLGLIVVTSFRFPWASYEGYSHARTIGEIEGKNGERGGWRGEDRDARMYVFEVKQSLKWKQKPKLTRRREGQEVRSQSSDSE